MFCSIDTEKNRLGLSLLEKDTGMPETISKEFRRNLRISDAAGDVQTDTSAAVAKKSVKRKAEDDLADDAGSQSKTKRAKVGGVNASSKKVKEASFC